MGEATVSKGVKWVAGSNSGLSLWFDKWLDTGTLRSCIFAPLNRGEEDIKLKDVAGLLVGTGKGCLSSFLNWFF